ncbi:MAG: hypothetical protein PHT54_00855 [Candidatus Nanoarchaeia archaeon]|nr:hypothetical protein [Candidatus Nanoarchaeia archaeon]
MKLIKDLSKTFKFLLLLPFILLISLVIALTIGAIWIFLMAVAVIIFVLVLVVYFVRKRRFRKEFKQKDIIVDYVNLNKRGNSKRD